jgi:hypothetical protein
MGLNSRFLESITPAAANAGRLEESMKVIHGMVLGLMVVMGSSICSGQDAKVPFGQIERDAQLSTKLTLPGNDIASNLSSSDFSSSNPVPGVATAEPLGSAAGFERVSPVVIHRSFSPSYWMVNGLHLGLAVLDVETTHQCIVSHHCREGNPLVPSSLGGALTVNISLVSFSSYVSYRLKKHDARMWWLSPVVGPAAHTVGLATGLAHRR